MQQNNAIAAPMQSLPSGGSLTESFGSSSTAIAGVESAAVAAAAQAKAAVEARYIMALRRPRNWDEVRQRILAECRRPAFANNKSALYRKPIGAGVEGLGIRFAELAVRCMTNCLIESALVFEDAEREINRVTLTDLESNTTYPMDVRIGKTVERSKPADDGSYISARKNSYGKLTYLLPASDEDLLNKRGAAISKAVRTLVLRVLPGDIQDEAEQIIRAIREARATQDPEAERKSIADGFFGIGVRAGDLAEYLGHDLSTCNPAELVELRGIYGAIRDGEATWQQAIEARREMRRAREKGADERQNGAPAGAGRGPLAPYPEADFEKALAGWAKAVKGGKRTPEQIIANVGERFRLSDQQAARIRALADAGAQPVAAQPQEAQASPAAGENAQRISAGIEAALLARDADKLDQWGDLIGSVEDPAERAKLAGAYQAARKAFD